MLILGNLICLGVFLNGLRFSRLDRVPFKSVEWFGRDITDPSDMLKKVQLIGRVQMFVAPFFAIFWTLAALGVFGHVAGFGE